MKEIPLKGLRGVGKFLIIDDDDFEYLTENFSWHIDEDGYAKAWVRKHKKALYPSTSIFAHRVIMGNPEGKEIDHKNGIKLDCRKDNLRIATTQENKMNRTKTIGISKYKGVSPFSKIKPGKKRFRAQIRYNRDLIYLGCFYTEEEAAKVYDKKAKELFGEFAKLNFPEAA